MAKLAGEHLKQVEVKSVRALRQWLANHHQQAESIWLVTYKKHTGDTYVSKDDIIDEALCYGWIDSVPRKLDAERTMVMLSPRKPNSAWSKVNKDKVKILSEQGRLQAAGLKAIEIAKSNGQWDALNDVDTLTMPNDLQSALSRKPAANENFNAFAPSSIRGILEWIQSAKRDETRAKRISETVRLAARNIKANHPEAKGK